MRVLRTAVYGALAVSAAGLVFLHDPNPIQSADAFMPIELNIFLSEQPAVVFQALESPVPTAELLVPPVQFKVSPEAEVVQEWVQPIEERGDAMLFEAEALFGTPFGQAIVMPFE